jgi:UDP-glucose 4-epimerase
MKSQRVLVTGGAGLIGSHITELLVREGAGEIIVLDNFVRGRRENLSGALPSGRVTVVEGDIRDRRLVRKVMDGVDLVFHQAAIRITQCAEEPRLAMEVLVDGAYKVKKVVAASSASVYGAADEFPTTEWHHTYNNRTLYGAAKAFNEALLRSFHEMYGLPYVALRYFNVYGPRMDVYGAYTEVLIRWMERIASGRPPLILGDGGQTMDFVYVEDIARANILAAKSGMSDDALNVATGVETSLDELAQTLLEVMGSDLQPEYGPARKVNAVPRRLADIRAAKLQIGFTAEVPVKEGLRRLVAWWREQQPGANLVDTPVAAMALTSEAPANV